MIVSILILMTSQCLKALLTALAMCLIPALLGWLAALAYYKVGELRDKVASLTGEVGELNGKVNKLTGDLTDLRVKLTQAEAELDNRSQQMSKLKNDLIIAESERNILKAKWDEHEANLAGGAKKAAAAAPAVAAAIMFAGKKFKADDLKIVEGIGPKIEELLHAAGIKTWEALSETAPERIKEILDAAGPNFQIHDPGTWPDQARLAHLGEWDALKVLQDALDGGKVG
jgi:predicted flap endonuclease-1-like 5' DNA nuclease